MAGLPYRLQVKRYDPKAFLIASKYPLSGDHVVYYDYLPLIVQTTVHLPSGTFSLWVVHTNAPIPGSFAEWKGALDFIAKLVAARGVSRLLVVGDFNATWGNKGFRSILDTGVTDGAAARGHAFAMTWSQKLRRSLPWSGSIMCSPGPVWRSRRSPRATGPGAIIAMKWRRWRSAAPAPARRRRPLAGRCPTRCGAFVASQLQRNGCLGLRTGCRLVGPPPKGPP